MKIRFESQKTTIRLRKDEFSEYLDKNELIESTIFPDGKQFTFHLKLSDEKSFAVNDGFFHICLPQKVIRNYSPSKVGISFEFQLDNTKPHLLIFEVDIKKKPLNSRTS
ncbi:MAG: hypothetical protein P8H03_08200 [Emcibacteraceae bacterium]|nr:hypothetical protein [Emcibacteraceae bacterium]MDG1995324.1 hypothetical protein [Emcibacteraceae bacterium]